MLRKEQMACDLRCLERFCDRVCFRVSRARAQSSWVNEVGLMMRLVGVLTVLELVLGWW
jgi:hypothetical protein